MVHLAVDGWSQRSSPLHSRDARAKLGVLLALLIAIATTPAGAQGAFAGFGALLLGAGFLSRLPIAGLLWRAAAVLPFAAAFAVASWLAGDGVRALALLERSYLSSLAALLFVATTPVPDWTAALESWRCPRFLILAIQFLYRYLFVAAHQAQQMRRAAASRGGGSSWAAAGRDRRMQAAGGAVAVLFARSSERAEAVYRSMVARGFQGHFPVPETRSLRISDVIFAGVAVAACVGLRLAL